MEYYSLSSSSTRRGESMYEYTQYTTPYSRGNRIPSNTSRTSTCFPLNLQAICNNSSTQNTRLATSLPTVQALTLTVNGFGKQSRQSGSRQSGLAIGKAAPGRVARVDRSGLLIRAQSYNTAVPPAPKACVSGPFGCLPCHEATGNLRCPRMTVGPIDIMGKPWGECVTVARFFVPPPPSVCQPRRGRMIPCQLLMGPKR